MNAYRRAAAAQPGAICYQCQREWSAMPAGFVIPDTGHGIKLPGAGELAEGYCGPCADKITEDQAEFGYGTDRHETWLLELERGA